MHNDIVIEGPDPKEVNFKDQNHHIASLISWGGGGGGGGGGGALQVG